MSTKGQGAAETKAAFDRARALTERAEALGEPAEDPTFAILRPLRFLHTEVYRLQRRCCMHACKAIPYARGAAESDSPHNDRASSAGQFLAVCGRGRRRASPSRPRFSALRLCRASSAGDPIWPRHRSGDPELSAISSVVAWLFRDCVSGTRPRDQRCSRDGSRPNGNVCATLHHVRSNLLPRACDCDHAAR
jgi:hypothetical protein